MAGHDNEVELPGPIDRSEVAVDPLHVGPLLRHLQHRLGGIEPAQPSCVPGFPRQAQQLARPASDIEHALRRHHQRKIELEIRPARAERVI